MNPAVGPSPHPAQGSPDSDSFGETRVIDTSAADQVAELIADMQSRWERGERPLCDDYLKRLPDPKLNVSAAVDLVYCEFLVRRQFGLPASADAFVHRFPELETPLRRQFELENALQGMTGSTSEFRSKATPTHPLLMGQALPAAIGRYTLVAPLESGGQADVFLGVHPTLHQNVVVKIDKRPLTPGSSGVEGLLQEGRALASLDHENLVRVYDVDVVEGYPIVVLQYVAAPSLDQYVRGRKLGSGDIASLVAALARAVAHVHRKNLLHLDIKPRNVLVEESGRPRLIDFGLARLVEAWAPSDENGHISGTLSFMSPEQISGNREEIGQPADIFALGAILYYLMTGHPPYVADTLEKIIPLVRFGRWNAEALDASAFDRRLKQLCRDAMQFDPRKRCPSADEFARRLEPCIAPPAHWRRWAMAGVAAATVGLLGVIWGSRSGTSPPVDGAGISASDQPLNAVSPQLLATVWSDDHLATLPERLPLANGDELHLKALVPRGQQGVLLHHDPQAGWTVMERWEKSDQDQEIQFPSRDQNLPLAGGPGPQLFVLCCAPSVGPAIDLLRAHSDGLRNIKSLSSYTVIHVDPAGVRTEHGGRGFDVPVRRAMPEVEFEEELRAMTLEVSTAGGQLTGLAFQKK